jgi:hypothetical protein
MTKKTKYEKPIVQKLGYDGELAVGACTNGGGFKTACSPSGNRALACTGGSDVGTCTAGTGPPPS